LNDLIKEATDTIRTKSGQVLRGVHYANMKRHWAGVVRIHAHAQHFDPIAGPAHYEIEFVEPNRRRDPDGLVAGGLKIIFDALQEAGLMQNDGWANVLSISPTWRVDKTKPGVRLTVRT
jgi:Holliday junction resolvase RusA-like endonuclease